MNDLINGQLVYLPERKRDLSLDHENIDLHVTINGGIETKEDKKIKKPGLLKWLKPQVVCLIFFF